MQEYDGKDELQDLEKRLQKTIEPTETKLPKVNLNTLFEQILQKPVQQQLRQKTEPVVSGTP